MESVFTVVPYDPMEVDAFDVMVEAWNEVDDRFRAQMAGTCRTIGHNYRDVPFSEPDDRTVMCLVCRRYLRDR